MGHAQLDEPCFVMLAEISFEFYDKLTCRKTDSVAISAACTDPEDELVDSFPRYSGAANVELQYLNICVSNRERLRYSNFFDLRLFEFWTLTHAYNFLKFRKLVPSNL